MQTFLLVYWSTLLAINLIKLLTEATGRSARMALEDLSEDSEDESDEEDIIDVEARVREEFDPEEIRNELKKLKKKNPYLEPLVKMCIKHMDTMDALQEAVEKMQEIGYAGEKLENISEALDEVEQEICQNMRDIMTICLAGGSLNGNIKLDDVDQDELNAEIESNKEKLKKVQELVRLCGKYVTQKDNDATNVGIESWIKTLEMLTENGPELLNSN